MKSNNIKIFLLAFITILITCLKEDEIIELDPNGNLADPNDPDILLVPNILTNDIHISFCPKNILLPNVNTYTIGRPEYLGKYFSILSKTWGDRLLYFDTGDQFQGVLKILFQKEK